MATQSLEISEDALKLMVAENGVRGTARMLGMDERQTEAFKRRVSRAGWMSDPAIAAIHKQSNAPSAGRPLLPAVPKMSPIAAVQAELASLGSKTRLSLARGVSKAANHVETLSGSDILEKSAEVKAVAQTADLVHGWKDAAPQVKIRLDVLNASPEPVIDVTSESQVLEDWEDASDPLDDY